MTKAHADSVRLRANASTSRSSDLQRIQSSPLIPTAQQDSAMLGHRFIQFNMMAPISNRVGLADSFNVGSVNLSRVSEHAVGAFSTPTLVQPRAVVEVPPEHRVTADVVRKAARAGISSPAQRLPHLETVQRAFGHHDLKGVDAHVGPQATVSAAAMNACAYATGNHIVFAGTPTLHTVAHEAAHVIQQRSGALSGGGVGAVGDDYERHADTVAARVVAGQSAEQLLDCFARGPSAARVGSFAPVQRAVGFEFQCRHWQIFQKKADEGNVQYVKYDPGKGQEALMQKDGWKMISDGGEPEFVVEHCDEHDQERLAIKMQSLIGVAKLFDDNLRKNEEFSVRQLGATTKKTADLVIRAQKAVIPLNGDPQVTAGIRFERLLDLFDEFTSNKDTKEILFNNQSSNNYRKDMEILKNSLIKAKKLVRKYRQQRNKLIMKKLKDDMIQDNGTNEEVKRRILSEEVERHILSKETELLTSDSDLAFGELCKDGLDSDFHNELSEHLKKAQTYADTNRSMIYIYKYAGFVALLASYLRKAQKKDMPFIKDFAFLSKTNLAVAAREVLPETMPMEIFRKNVLSASDIELKDNTPECSHSAQQRQGEDQNSGTAQMNPIGNDDVPNPIYRSQQRSPDIGTWLDGLYKKNRDELSSLDNDSFADPSMGLWRRTDFVGRDGVPGIILELRRVKNDMPYTDWKNWAESVRAWIYKLNAAAAGNYDRYKIWDSSSSAPAETSRAASKRKKK